MAALIGRRPLLSFVVLACLLSWWPAALYAVDASPLPIASFGPFLAALVVLALTGGRAAVWTLLRSMVAWRVPRRAYLLAIGLPLAFSGGAVMANLAWGAEPVDGGLATWTAIPATALFVLLIPGVGGAWEEPGFRGFALPRLEQRFGAMTGPLVLGVLWVLWHAPLFLVGQILWTDVLTIVAASVVIAAVFHTARESVLVVMIMHATNNAVGGSYASQLFDGADQARLGTLTAIAWWAGAAAVLITMKRSSGTAARSGDSGESLGEPE
ncbi:CPBP family intramembrane glutamic endopeptidase [uncultured Serinicoccus sp.]|uniref:CPBP family intramembrane glutamic endopeptidase n=1 Tax=uncultured Serinicoccus sp. TaxID=735514 RepID=UPI0026174ABB|nr:CPBP family intramembrane glutamic endopeptidase [uncultured Serinicoccus sp.]